MAGGKDLSDFERGFIIGAQMAGASVTKTAQLAGVSIFTNLTMDSGIYIFFTFIFWARQAWDCAREVPVIQDEQKRRKLLSFIELFTVTFVGIVVFGLAFFSKTSLLLLITISSKESVTISTKPYALLFIGILLVAPSVLTLIKSFWKITFKDSKTPSKHTILWVVFVETLVAFGAAVLTIVTMPKFDILTNVMLLNSVGILSALFQVVANSLAQGKKRFTATSLAAVIFLLVGYVLFLANYLQEDFNKREIAIAVGLAIGSTCCVSLNWWENYATLFKNSFLQNITADIKRSRNLVSILASAVKIMVTFVVLGAYVRLSEHEWSSVQYVSYRTKTIVLSLFAIQVISTVLCRWFVVVACKMHAVGRSFVLPLLLASPAAFASFILAIWMPFRSFNQTIPHNGSFAVYCQSFVSVNGSGIAVMEQLATDLTKSLCARTAFSEGGLAGQLLLSCSVICWWIGLVLCTLYIWFLQINRIERTRDLFVRSLYEAAFIDQSMLLNARFEILNLKKKKNRDLEEMTIYLCATMWHETFDEMIKMLISMFRLDKFRPKRNSFNDASFESHIYFDDAFEQDGNEHRVNEYAEMLVEAVREVYMIFSHEDKSIFKKRNPLPNQKIIQTPYGGRLQYTLPHGNMLIIHFKDKQLIRHKKRWSQIMYLYFLLGWKLNRKYFQMFEEAEEEARSLEDELKKMKANTYILALDGDTDFQPSAVMLLVDRLRMYPEVGAACGRIHPTGTGPMVWYQKFEYAVGHWLQKTAEHVLGCVLCSPGCFSLFRAAALMDDNVMKKYTTKASEAGQYVQYDQGEDRWLCTLLLQQGWRVEYNAASDSYTNAPQEFKEFYNQRRRWGPSTMANTLDLLGSGNLTSQKNKSISKPFILYQIISMSASILGPATVCLMIAGSFSFVFGLHPNVSLALAIAPPTIYLILCFKLKSNTQITIAAVMSVCYAFLMTASVLSIIGDMVQEGTFMTPSGLFLVGISLMYTITALLHPHEFQLIIYGFLYILCIPSGYLLLAIYSLVNMNNVSWGTRETASQAKATPAQTIKKNIKYKKTCKVCCWNMKIQVTEDEKVTTAPVNVPKEAPPVSQEPDIVNLQEEKELEVQVQSSWIKQLMDKSGDLNLDEDVLDEDETRFWVDLQNRYLKPLEEDKADKKRVEAELKDLRNKATFVFFVCNALWLVATFFLQAIGSNVSIAIPKLYVNGTVDENAKLFIDPIGLMFVVGFASLLVIQFLAMLWHRIQTLIHFIAYTGTEAAVVRKTLKKHMEMENEDEIFL